MRFVKGLIGFVTILFGSLLMSITIEDAMAKNITLKIVGALILIIGITVLQMQIHKDKNKNS